MVRRAFAYCPPQPAVRCNAHSVAMILHALWRYVLKHPRFILNQVPQALETALEDDGLALEHDCHLDGVAVPQSGGRPALVHDQPDDLSHQGNNTGTCAT